MAAFYDLGTIDQGTTWRRRVRWLNSENQPISLSGYTTVRMHVRQTVTDTATLVELTNANGRATISANEVNLVLTDDVTSALTPWDSPAVYDLELIDAAGDVHRLLEGVVSFSREVTR